MPYKDPCRPVSAQTTTAGGNVPGFMADMAKAHAQSVSMPQRRKLPMTGIRMGLLEAMHQTLMAQGMMQLTGRTSDISSQHCRYNLTLLSQ